MFPPEPLFGGFGGDTDLIQWDEPSWLDERPAESRLADSEFTVDPTSPDEPRHGGRLLESDWVDRFEAEGLPVRGRDPLVAPEPLPSVAVEPPDRFELIWPSGEVDEEFGATDASGRNDDPDHDRVGPTARIARSPEPALEPTPESAPEPQPAPEPHREVGSDPASVNVWGAEPTETRFDPRGSSALGAPSAVSVPNDTGSTPRAEAPTDVPIDDDVVLSMRRAVASIETGSLEARRRLAENTQTDGSSRGVEPVVPGRVAARTDTAWRAASGTNVTPMRSVFDDAVDEDAPTGVVDAPIAPASEPPITEPAVTESAVSEPPASESPEPMVEAVEHVRLSALRRLIGGLRRR
jgi:hypothetical protein